MDTSIISDSKFDRWSKGLVTLQKEYPEEAKQSVYYKAFVDFDGSTGCDLPYNQPNIQNTGNWLVKQYKEKTTG